MELGTTAPMTGDKKTFFFYPLLAILHQNLSWLDHNFKYGAEKIEKYNVTMTYGGHRVFGSQLVRVRIFWTSTSYAEKRYILYNCVPL